MSHKSWIFWIALVILGVVALAAGPVAADSTQQVVYQTPTARPDGRVIYIVQANDSCLRIQLLTGTTIDQLRTLNKLDQNCTINPGQELLLKVVTPAASATPNPLITSTPLLPTPTQIKGNGKICVLLYEDVNGNAVHEPNESPLAGGAVSITNQSGTFSKTINTSSSADPLCVDVAEGEYNLSMAIPSGYNPTKAMNGVVQVLAGDQAIFEFGAQKSSDISPAQSNSPITPPAENSIPLAIVGGLLVLLGIGLGSYILFARRSSAG